MSLSQDEIEFIEAQSRVFKPYGAVAELDMAHTSQIGNRAANIRAFCPYPFKHFSKAQVNIIV